MKPPVAVNGEEALFEFEGAPPALHFRLGGQPFREARVEIPEPGVYSVLLGGRSFEARVEHTGDGIVVSIGPRRYEIEVRDPRQWSGGRRARGVEGRQEIAAAMPGKVVRVLVAEGDRVEAGQGVVVVEAMKMQNELQSRKAGQVVVLRAREGATVAAGEVLASIE